MALPNLGKGGKSRKSRPSVHNNLTVFQHSVNICVFQKLCNLMCLVMSSVGNDDDVGRLQDDIAVRHTRNDEPVRL
jgi:hypothetical protein